MRKKKINFGFQYQSEANKEFYYFCCKGNIEQIENVLFYNKGIVPDITSRHPDADVTSPKDYCIITSIKYGQIDVLKFFFEDERTKNVFTYENAHNWCVEAIENGKLDVLKFFLSHEKTKDNINLNSTHINLLAQATKSDQFDIVKYLTSSDDINVSVDPKLDPWTIIWPCSNGNLEIVDFLLSKYPEIDIHCSSDTPFKLVLLNNHMDTVDYLIFDYGIKLTEQIKLMIRNNDNIKNKFTLRTLNEELTKGLSEKKDFEKNKGLKI